MAHKDQIIPSERIEKSIFLIRSQKVMLDANLAELYEVPTKVFNQAVKRNKGRFPADFMFLQRGERWKCFPRATHKRSANASGTG